MPTSATFWNRADGVRRRDQRLVAASSRSGSGRKGASCAHADLAAAAGFTLLELLVVLLLVGLITALALPNLERLLTTVTTSTERDYILDQIAGLGRRAMLQERAYVVLGTRHEEGADVPEPARMTLDGVRDDSGTRISGSPAGPGSRSDYEHYAIDVPEGWEIRLDKPLVVHANGVCLGAVLTLYDGEAEDFRVALEPPYCRVDPDA